MKRFSLWVVPAVMFGGAVAWADPPPAKTAELLAAGKTSFTTNCASCHGATGMGDGVASAALNPKPRNFKTEEFKFGSSLEAVFATLAKGSPGTAMIAWPHLPESERWALAYFVEGLGRPAK